MLLGGHVVLHIVWSMPSGPALLLVNASQHALLQMWALTDLQQLALHCKAADDGSKAFADHGLEWSLDGTHLMLWLHNKGCIILSFC